METNNLEDITIENMLANIFTNTTIKKKRKDIVDFYRLHLVKDLFSTSPDSITEEQIAKRVDTILKEGLKGDAPQLAKGKDGKYHKSKNKGKTIGVPKQNGIVDTNYIGKAGECAVMSELLLNGYNVNNMMVDEGIDLVASKDNVFYYIQVKMRYINNANKFSFQIKDGRYDRYLGTQIRYILVGRGVSNNYEHNFFFIFDNRKIDELRYKGIIGPSTANNININIEFDTKDGKPYAYNGVKREDIGNCMNNFDL